MEFAVRNGALFIHQSKTYLLGTYSALATVLGDWCFEENRVEKVDSRLQGWGISLSVAGSGIKGWCLNTEMRERDMLTTRDRQQVQKPWDASISVAFKKSNVSAVEGTGECIRWGRSEASRGACEPLKELWFGRFEQRTGKIRFLF